MKIRLLHGFTQNRMALTPFCRLLEVVTGVEVSVVEVPYHGDSRLAGRSLREVSENLGELYGDHDCIFVGYSLGGRILLEALASRTLESDGVIVFGAALDEGGEEARQARIEADKRLAAKVGAIVGKDDFERFLIDWLKAPLFNGISRDQAQVNSRLTNEPKEIAKALRDLSTGFQEGLLERLKDVLSDRGVVNQPPKYRLGYIYGANDVKFKGVARNLKDQIDTIQIEEIASCGHFTIGERPYESAIAISKIVQGWNVI
ncbi:MAG: alpha/beta fold hydrolase [Actinomycetota bacterium]|nr:alpha/beta fold hydrolase [Actinomycetota bacterium]